VATVLVMSGLSVIAAGAEQVAPAASSTVTAPKSGTVGPNPQMQCVTELKSANVEFAELGRISRGDCSVEDAVQLNSVSSPFGNVLFPGKPTLACAFSKQLTRWVRDVAAPLTLAYMSSKLAAIETGQSFECRTRYNAPGEKVSEHAKGDAIDITAFRLENGRKLLVKDASASSQLDGVLMRAYRVAGCGYFTTVLGPGSNDAHKEHFHFDNGMHGNSSDYRICE
jgi:hypothetical protein